MIQNMNRIVNLTILSKVAKFTVSLSENHPSARERTSASLSKPFGQKLLVHHNDIPIRLLIGYSYFLGDFMFGTILISIVTLMHVYVFWRAVSVPFIKSPIPKKILSEQV
jgi:hypothetical protein